MDIESRAFWDLNKQDVHELAFLTLPAGYYLCYVKGWSVDYVFVNGSWEPIQYDTPTGLLYAASIHKENEAKRLGNAIESMWAAKNFITSYVNRIKKKN